MAKMKITAGLGSLDNFHRMVSAGADELFAGFVPLDWLEKYSNHQPLNRRENLLQNIQINTLADLRLLAKMKADSGVNVAIAFNSPFYGADCYSMIADILADLSSIGMQDWIIADPGLLVYLQNAGLSGGIHLSGEAGAYNPDAVRFFKKLGVKRIIFPRKISPEHMAECICAAPNLQYEAFVLNEMCHFSGAFCASLHCDFLDPLCRVPYQVFGPDCRCTSPDRDPSAFGAGGCGVCALPRLSQAGVGFLKVVGRGGHVDLIERDLRLLRRILDESILPDISQCSHNCYYR